MSTAFQIKGLDPSNFEDLLHLSNDELAARGVVVETDGGPCRVTLEDVPEGEEVLLLNFCHQPTDSPYRAQGPIYVRRNAQAARLNIGEVPASVRERLLSVRAYDDQGMIVNAEVTEGSRLEDLIESMFAEPKAAYLHVHYARFGCYACQVDRA